MFKKLFYQLVNEQEIGRAVNRSFPKIHERVGTKNLKQSFYL